MGWAGARGLRWRFRGPSWTSDVSAPLWWRRQNGRPTWGSDASRFSWRGACIVRFGPPAGSCALSTGFWGGLWGAGGSLRVARSGACSRRSGPTDRPSTFFVPCVGASGGRLGPGLWVTVQGALGAAPLANGRGSGGPGAPPAWRPLGLPFVRIAWGLGCGLAVGSLRLWPCLALAAALWVWRSGPPLLCWTGVGTGATVSTAPAPSVASGRVVRSIFFCGVRLWPWHGSAWRRAAAGSCLRSWPVRMARWRRLLRLYTRPVSCTSRCRGGRRCSGRRRGVG